MTEVLRDVGLVETYGFLSAKHRDAAATRGKALHLAIQLYHEGTLDEATIHPLIRPAFDAYVDWAESEQWEWRHSELELFHPWGFCGHIDLAGNAVSGPVIIDLKHTDAVQLEDAALQLAGYGILWDANYLTHVLRLVLQLPKKGRAKVHDVTSAHATQVFTAAWMVWSEKKRRGK